MGSVLARCFHFSFRNMVHAGTFWAFGTHSEIWQRDSFLEFAHQCFIKNSYTAQVVLDGKNHSWGWILNWDAPRLWGSLHQIERWGCPIHQGTTSQCAGYPFSSCGVGLWMGHLWRGRTIVHTCSPGEHGLASPSKLDSQASLVVQWLRIHLPM